MARRPLRSLSAAPGSAAVWTTALAAALGGSGPALTPDPAAPPAAREELRAALRPDDPDAPLEFDEVALVVPTSGSTGEPKGAMLSAAALRASARATHARLGGPGHWVLALPLTHVAGLMVVIRALEGGGATFEVDLSAGFEPAAFAAATAGAAAAASSDGLPLYGSLVPTQLGRLLDAGVDLSGYAAVLVGAAAAPAGLLQRAAGAGVRVVTTYGMSETCGGCVYDGYPLDNVSVDLDDSGRVLLGGPTLFAGYRLRPDLTRAAVDSEGRLVTSDLGQVGGDGRLRVLGRADDVLVSGGENIAPAAVEAALSALPAVGASVVVGLPDEEWGQRVVAVVVATGGSTLRLHDLRAALAHVLPPAAVPAGLVLVPELPMLATGKPDRAAAGRLAARDFASRESATRDPRAGREPSDAQATKEP
jgi:o-succinylbenzoate---CoA ligase